MSNNTNVCGVAQFLIMFLQVFSGLNRCGVNLKPDLSLNEKCSKNVYDEFHERYNQMFTSIEKNVKPVVETEISNLLNQLEYNKVNYFNFAFQRITKLYLYKVDNKIKEFDYNQLFSSINNCIICDNLTIRSCFKKNDFVVKFVKTIRNYFTLKPIETEKKRENLIKIYNENKNITTLTKPFDELLNLFDVKTKDDIELKMKELIKDQTNNCCFIKNTTDSNTLLRSIKPFLSELDLNF